MYVRTQHIARPNSLTVTDRHPSRQGAHPEIDYQMQHDIYSLGVVLLEIGLWTSFLVYDDGQSASPTASHVLGNPEPSQGKPLGNSFHTKARLEILAEQELPARLGRRYSNIVLSCLRCMDPATGSDEGGSGFGADVASYKDEDGIIIGVRFIENVLVKIQEIIM